MTLRALFAEYNRRYWGGRLPAYSVRRVSRIPGSTCYQEGLCDSVHRTIYVLASLPEERARQTLLHEMCHVAERGRTGCHGKRFLRELRRLAAAGEAWATSEADMWASPFRRIVATRPTIMRTMEDMTLNSIIPTWRGARQAIAAWYGLTLRDFDHRFPWARDRWRRIVAREQRDRQFQEALFGPEAAS